MKTRISKALASAGVASRRKCEELIFSGRVTLNGDVVTMPQTLVDLTCDRVEINGQHISACEKKVYYLLNKPLGYICTTVFGRAKRVLDLFDHLPYRLFTVGRLDQMTKGLIIVTNDGVFANRVTHPSFEITKEYLAKTAQEITHEHLQLIGEGVAIDGVVVKPHSVKKVRRGTLKIAVKEGKKHEVRELLAHASLTLLELTRIRIGPITLDTLAEGSFRELSPEEICRIMK